MPDTTIFEDLTRMAPPRFTALELPLHRYVPGSRPHPVADPEGHSYVGVKRFPVAPVDGQRWRASPGYLYGCDLYNRGFWWEAHEAWEAIWQLAVRGSPERAALQGLIQLANCHLKLYMGRLNAVRRLQESYTTHLDRAAELSGTGLLGLDLTEVRVAANDYFYELSASVNPVHDPKRFPYLVLAAPVVE